MTKTATAVPLIWTGPDGHYWPALQEVLVAGQRYQVEASLAAYLCERHPDHWQRPPAPPRAALDTPKE